jgi:3-hydroxyisobutyrate dehydrogenase
LTSTLATAERAATRGLDTLVPPVFATFGNPVVHLGPLGSGLIVKLINNLVFTAQISIALGSAARSGDSFG